MAGQGEDALPRELWLHIFAFLPVRLTGRLALTCKLWHSVCNEEHLWKQWYLRDFHFSPDVEGTASWQDRYRYRMHLPKLGFLTL